MYSIVSKSVVLFTLFGMTSCYITNTALSEITFTRNEPSNNNVHSEYYFGKCANIDKVLITHHHWTYEEIKGKMIVRAFLTNLRKNPTCVYVRAESLYSESVRYHAYKFNICFCKIIYNYSGRVWKYFYYEWFIPVTMTRGISWDLYFYKG